MQNLLRPYTETAKIAAMSYAVFTDGVLDLGAFGVTRYDEPETIDPFTLFDEASLTKVMVTLPLCLIAFTENKLTLETPLSLFFKVPSSWQDVTVLDLLVHRSGIEMPLGEVADDQSLAKAILQG